MPTRNRVPAGSGAHGAEGRSSCPPTASRITIGAAHNDQIAAVREHPDRHSPHLAAITVDTANRLQAVSETPSSGTHCPVAPTPVPSTSKSVARASPSRYRVCIAGGRAGIRDLLDRHLSSAPVYLDVPPKFPEGRRAHQTVLEPLGRPEYRVSRG